MIVIDACASRVLVEAMADGKLPNFKALAETGYFSPNCLSIFPSITHAATASLATPQNHGIAGAASSIAQILFFIFLVLFVVSLFMGRRRRI